MNRDARKAAAEETLRIIERGSYVAPRGATIVVADAIRECREATRLYTPDDLSSLERDVLARPSPGFATRIEVVNETTLAGVRRLVAEAGDVAALNFASAKNPGGGFLSGAQAQEESLARSSALYASQLAAPAFYERHRASTSLLYSDTMIASPRCPVFRDDDGALLDVPRFVNFITSAAPNAGAITQQRRDELPLIEATLRRRAGYVLALAASQGWHRLVLGAWGCGVFRNDPRNVAEIFNALLRGDAWRDRFEQVVFSVLDTSPTQATFRAFRDALVA
jgi:uncharacterized protein (TIGR02452 family)